MTFLLKPAETLNKIDDAAAGLDGLKQAVAKSVSSSNTSVVVGVMLLWVVLFGFTRKVLSYVKIGSANQEGGPQKHRDMLIRMLKMEYDYNRGEEDYFDDEEDLHTVDAIQPRKFTAQLQNESEDDTESSRRSTKDIQMQMM